MTEAEKPMGPEETTATAEEAGGLKRLEQEFQDLNLELLEVTLSEDFGELDRDVDEIFQKTLQIQEVVTNSLMWLANMATHINNITDPMKRFIKAGELARKQDQAEGQLDLWLNHKVPYFRLAASLAYLRYALCQTYKTAESVNKMLADLGKRGLFVEVPNGPIFIAYKHYVLGGSFGFDTDNSKDVIKWAGECSRKHMNLVSQERKAAADALKGQANISPEEVWDNEKATGICLFSVPPESFMHTVKGEYREDWRGGGPLQVAVTEKDIIPRSGAGGSLENQVKTLVEMHVRLPRHTIKWDCPPGGDGSNSENSRKAFRRTIEGVMKTTDLSEDQAIEYVKKMRMFWHLIIRAYCGMDAKQQQGALKEEFGRMLNLITPEQFFGLNGSNQPKDGVSLLEFEGAFQVAADKPSVFAPFVLARRSTSDDGRSVIEVLRIPPHAHDFLGGIVNKKYSEGEDFKELPGCLRRFLRAVRNRLKMACAIDNQ